MSLKQNSTFERLITHGVLIVGCLLFAFPFGWMVMTSIKVTRELNINELQFFPQKPIAGVASPYIDSAAYDEISRPSDIPEIVWEASRRRLVALLEDRVDAWTPQTEGPEGNPPPVVPRPSGFRNEMVEGLAEMLEERISDEARQRAVKAEKEIRVGKGETDLPSDAVLASQLTDEAIEAGAQAILASAASLIDDTQLVRAYEGCYRRLCLGGVRVRTADYAIHPLFTGDEWRPEGDAAELTPRHDGQDAAQEARYEFPEGSGRIAFAFEPETLPVSVDEIDRVFVRFRGDESWASVAFEIVRRGALYRTTVPTHLFDRNWIEYELRWPEGRGDPLERQTYYIVEPAEEAPDSESEFLVRMIIRQNTPLGAWKAKICRNYRQAFREVPYGRYLMTSFSLVILNILLAVFACTLVGYSFARLQWPGRNFCFGLLLATMMIPGQVTMIPNFLIMKSIGWFNTLMPMWAPAVFGAPFFIFLLRQFFKNIPQDLEDSARIDGCGFLRIYWHVMLPLVKPTIATIAIFAFMGAWNNFMGPLIYVNDERLFPLALGLFKFKLRSGADVGLMMAGSTMMTVPIIVLFFFVQRYFIQGISLTGTKG